ncbi:hypothetical protein CMI40_00330 [Candidatus Pacearchaeota archaeon]|nr:hypothetical protein [Candidatus Pacearchaeota archaeon]
MNINNTLGDTICFTGENTSILEKADLSVEKMSKFKRKALGFFGKETAKTLDEMAQLLYNAKIVSSIEKGKEIIPCLVKETELIKYQKHKALCFGYLRDKEGKPIKDKRNNLQCEITVFPCSTYLS